MSVSASGKHPSLVEVTRYDEVGEAWKCPHLSAAIRAPGDEFFHRGVINRLDGTEHVKRRRVMGELLKRRGHKYFRDTALFPTADRALREVLANPEADGRSRLELLSWGQRVNFRLASAIVGFDAGRDDEGADDLYTLMETLIRGRPSSFDVSTGGVDTESDAARRSLAAKQEILSRYFEPALARRRELARQVEAGDLDEEDLPQDLLMLIARRLDPAWDDHQLAQRDALFLFNAGVHTTSVSMYWSLRELFRYLPEHPEDRVKITEESFVLRVAQEALRLHPVTPGFPRVATDDVELRHGTTIPHGDMALIRHGGANLDAETFGEDADQFNPWREVPAGVQRYGYGFGSGPHMCYGAPIVMGSEGLDGSLVYLLTRLLRAGVAEDAADGDQPPLVAARGTYVHEPERYVLSFHP